MATRISKTRRYALLAEHDATARAIMREARERLTDAEARRIWDCLDARESAIIDLCEGETLPDFPAVPECASPLGKRGPARYDGAPEAQGEYRGLFKSVERPHRSVGLGIAGVPRLSQRLRERQGQQGE